MTPANLSGLAADASRPPTAFFVVAGDPINAKRGMIETGVRSLAGRAETKKKRIHIFSDLCDKIRNELKSMDGV